MSGSVVLKKELLRNNFFIFLKNCYFVMGGRIDMNVVVF